MADITYYLSLPYSRVLKRDEEGDIVATIAELDGCVAHGSNDSEALTNLHEAQRAWIEAALTDGQEIPLPEIEEELPSGKFVLRLPKLLHRRLINVAEKDDVSLNVLVIMAVTEHIARRDVKQSFAHDVSHRDAWRDGEGIVVWNVSSETPLRRDYLEYIQKRGVLEESREKKQHLTAIGKA